MPSSDIRRDDQHAGILSVELHEPRFDAGDWLSAPILGRCNRVAAGDALLLEHDLVAPVVDRDPGERPRQGGADEVIDDRAGWTRRRRDGNAAEGR